MRQILTQPVHKQAWLGVSVRDLDPNDRPTTGTRPIQRPAHSWREWILGAPRGAGIETGDVIVELAGQAITSANGLTDELTIWPPVNVSRSSSPEVMVLEPSRSPCPTGPQPSNRTVSPAGRSRSHGHRKDVR